MCMEYHLTLASRLNCEVGHVGHQADGSPVEKLDNRLHHEGQYLQRTFETKREHLLFIQFPFLFKLKEHGASLEPFPDHSDILHFEVSVTNELFESLQI